MRHATELFFCTLLTTLAWETHDVVPEVVPERGDGSEADAD